MNSPPSSLVRPSSLNYKISLSEAVTDFIKKDMPLLEDQYIDVHTEDPKSSGGGSGAGGSKSTSATDKDYDEFDDAMFDMTAPHH